MRKVYADNAATSFPKAPGVSDAMKDFLDNTGCNVNRGGYADSYGVSMQILETRQLIADLFCTNDPREVIFTPSVTYSLNTLLCGLLGNGGHVITTSMEHNAVMRPLHALSKSGVVYDCAPCGADGSLDENAIIPLIRRETKAVVMTYASNICGTVMPVEAVSRICRERGIRLIVDAAQAAGVLDISAGGIDALAFTGHKGLLGPQGIGGFVVKRDFAAEISPLVTGGTGSFSDKLEQPDILPDKFESGTVNIPAILGLKKAVEYINSIGMKAIRDRETALTAAFISKLSGIPGAKLIGKKDASGRVAVVSVDFTGRDNADIAAALDSGYGIMTRCGLHCAPIAHQTLGTYPHGTVRFSFGYWNTADEIEYIIQAIREIL
ncbi:MAG: aminotransferase class V-fold PLP-dependent enzyme [Oscillospiraceae bacterium]|nr:aminotransferase class V-fold PLP-dependent enzyme [Oscillospiraceae bacterium]